MLGLLIALIVIGLVAGAMGFTGIAVGAAVAARIVFFIMLIGIAIVLIAAVTGMAVLF